MEHKPGDIVATKTDKTNCTVDMIVGFTGQYYIDVIGPLGSCLSSTKYPNYEEANKAFLK